ncbi:hypothetical protein WN943_021705 [Citrus x changshan-huyou]
MLVAPPQIKSNSEMTAVPFFAAKIKIAKRCQQKLCAKENEYATSQARKPGTVSPVIRLLSCVDFEANTVPAFKASDSLANALVY